MSKNKKIVVLGLTAAFTVSACTHSSPAENTPSYSAAVDELNKTKTEPTKKKMSAEDKAVMARVKADLEKSMRNAGLKVGDKAPDFALENAYGSHVNLAEELQKGPVVLVFYRGAWCPYCNLHLQTLQQSMKQIMAAGGQLIAISPQQPDKSYLQVDEGSYKFQVLSDSSGTVMDDYKLRFTVDPALLEVYEKFEIDLEAYNGEGRTDLPIPAAYIVDGNGIIRFAQVDPDYTERTEPATLIKALKRIQPMHHMPRKIY